MSSPRWKTVLSKALAEHEASNTFQFATSDASGIPHVRTQILRGLMAPTSPASPLLVSSTDIRTLKVTHIRANPLVEMVFWLSHSQEQLRISGRASIVHSSEKPSPPGDIDWEKERLQSFDKHSGHMKASWCRPTPGSVMPGGYEEAKKWPQRLPSRDDENASEEDKRNLKIALGNFALVVVDPTDVDYVELGVQPNQRTVFKKKDDEWIEEIVVP